VHHRTLYRYERPVAFGVHRLMLRPRDGLDSTLTLSPPFEIRWEFDTFGNSVAFAKFSERADELVVQSSIVAGRNLIRVATTRTPAQFSGRLAS